MILTQYKISSTILTRRFIFLKNIEKKKSIVSFVLLNVFAVYVYVILNVDVNAKYLI